MISGILIGFAGAYVFSSGLMAVIVALDLIEAAPLPETEQDHL